MQNTKSSVTLENKHQNPKFLNEIKKIVNLSKKQKDQELVKNFWEIGKKISEQTSQQKINLENLAEKIDIQRTNLSRAILFFQTYKTTPNNSNLNWSHYRELLTIKDSQLRAKLEKSAQKENWSRDKLRGEINKVLTVKVKTIKRPTAPTYLYKAKILQVIDGDTLILLIDLGFGTFREQRLRLAQISCAELDTEEGKTCFEFTKNYLEKVDFVMVKTNKVDIYGRFVGDIFFDPAILEGKPTKMSKDDIFLKGIYFNEEIVKAGMAKIY